MIYDVNSTYKAAQGCIDWCKEQHYANFLNQNIEAIALLVLSILFISASYILLSYGEKFIKNSENITEDDVIKYIKIFHLAGLIFIAAYMFWFWMTIR